MRSAWVLMIVAGLAAVAVTTLQSAEARELRPDIPEEQGIRLVGRVGWVPYRCRVTPVQNFYHDALYDEAPALYRGYAYRPYYRYTAWHVMPRRYFCSDREQP